MSHLVDSILHLSPLLVVVVVWLLVFAEDAIFLGFVIPGESAAVVIGVAASFQRLPVWVAILVVVSAAIIGDTVGYEVGKHWFSRLLHSRPLRGHRHRMENAERFLREKGGPAVFLGRFTAFFRAVMPALAGASGMRYRIFVTWNAIGGVIWGTGFVLLGYAAGASYHLIEKKAGPWVTGAVVVIVIAALVYLHVRRRRAED